MDLPTRFESVRNRIAEAAKASKRDPEGIRLLAVSKKKPASDIEIVHSLGQVWFGENYVQELAEKKVTLAHCSHIRWSFIGRIQSNKLKTLAHTADEIQSLSSLKHATKLDRELDKIGKKMPCYILVNLDNEASKAGVSIDEAKQLAIEITEQCKHIEIQGTMTIPAQDLTKQELRYGNFIEESKSIGLGKVSLGMSNDLELAIAAGSHTVRIGTDIFGPRD